MEIMYVNMLLQQNLFLFTTQHRTGSVDSVFELFKIVQYNLGIQNYNINKYLTYCNELEDSFNFILNLVELSLRNR